MRGDGGHDPGFRLREKSGEYRWIEGRVRPVRDAAGAVVGRVGGWRDIEAEVAALEALAQSEAVLRTALRSAAIGMALTDEHGAFTLVNPALATMLGRDEEWLLGHRVDDVVQGEHDTLVDGVRDGLTTGRVDKYEGNLPLLRADGQPLWARVAAVKVASADDAPPSFMIQVVDVTVEREAQDELATGRSTTP